MAKRSRQSLIDALEARCAAGGHRLTPLRRQVFSLLLEHGGRATAYQLIDDLPSLGRQPAPPSIYRALDFLIGVGFVKRLSSTNTFIVATGNIVSARHAVFVVCRLCGATETLTCNPLERALTEAAASAHYAVQGCHTEVQGICASCQRVRLRAPANAGPAGP